MRSLTTKLVLAFLAVGITGAALTAYFARRAATQQFDVLMLEQARSTFLETATAYYEANGSWAGIAASTTFSDQRDGSAPGGTALPGQNPNRPVQSAPPRLSFALADAQGVIVRPAGNYQLGQAVAPPQLAQGTSVEIDDVVVGTILDLDLQLLPDPHQAVYLEQTRQAALYAALGASVVALLVGWILARTLTRPVQELSGALKAMSDGALGQQVVVRSQDELGQLGQTFNQMSQRLTETTTALETYTAELETSNQDLEAFAHTVAHDLKTPLTALIGFSKLLEKRHQKLDGQALGEQLHTISNIGEKMTRIIDELLLMASVRQMDEINLGLLDMTTIAQEATRRLEQLIAEYDAQITLPSAWPAALGYGPWVEEVWTNYISNALKYGGKPPAIQLGAETTPEGQVRFWVHDNGDGLTPEQQTHVFEQFTRFHAARIEGHGLGLSIVQRIVKKLGGQVGVESDGIAGHGSVFYFTLPAAVAESSGLRVEG